MIKSAVLIFYSILIMLSLTACGGSEVQPSAKDSPAAIPPSRTEKLKESTEPPDEGDKEEAYSSSATELESTLKPEIVQEQAMNNIQITVAEKVFYATLEDNTAAEKFVELLKKEPIVIQMSDYAGFEKIGSLGDSLPESNRQMTAQAGDIILYSGNQICIFYGSNSWSYTKLGKIDDLSGWQEALGNGDVKVMFSIIID